MQQLTGLDASFLFMETANVPMHIGSLAIYDQSTAPGGQVRFKEIIDNLDKRMREIPLMTMRLQNVPLNMDHPYWVNDGNFDAEFHIRHISLPKPGDWRQLCILVARLHARQLDRSRPLWEFYVIEGLDNVEGTPPGSFAIVSKMHHALIDGTSGAQISMAVHDMTPDYKRKKAAAVINVDHQPSSIELLARSALNSIKKPFRFVSVARNTVPGFAQAFNRVRKGELKRSNATPRTRFNKKVSPHRVFDAMSVPLEDVKVIKNAVPGATVNDAAIAIVGGALRKYLSHHQELPEASLIAQAPINVRSDKDKTGGNVVSTMAVAVRSDIEDPMERLKAVHEGAKNAKELSAAVGVKDMMDFTQFVPYMLAAQGARVASEAGLMSRLSPQFSCVITNVPGPAVPLYSTGCKMVANHGIGPVIDGVGLFQVISSYCGVFTINVTCCRDIMPDPAFYRECLEQSFEDLLSGAQAAAK